MRLTYKQIANKQNCLGFIAKDTNTNLFLAVHNNDMYFIFQELIDIENEKANIINKIDIGNGKFIYQLEKEDLSNCNLITYEQAIEEFKQDI